MFKPPVIFVINPGSSSIKFRLFSIAGFPAELLSGKIVLDGKIQNFIITLAGGQQIFYETGPGSAAGEAGLLLNWVKDQTANYNIKLIGYRVVHGGLKYSAPEPVNAGFIDNLKKIIPLAPLHLPNVIKLMEIFRKAFPEVKQVACFDTSFHKSLPFEAGHFALPVNLWKDGIVRYGFHGLSCQYIMEYLIRTMPLLKDKRIIIAHLGSGCSITAIKNNRSIDTTMGLSPSGGIMMNTRCGDLDPGVIFYLLKHKKMTVSALDKLINQEAGLKAIAGTGDSISELLKKEPTNSRAARAIRMFCYQVKKQVGALAVALEGLDMLIFTGGIGEHEHVIRERICGGLNFLGIAVNKELNNRSAEEIAEESSRVSVYVIPTNEELVIAKNIFKMIAKPKKELV